MRTKAIRSLCTEAKSVFNKITELIDHTAPPVRAGNITLPVRDPQQFFRLVDELEQATRRDEEKFQQLNELDNAALNYHHGLNLPIDREAYETLLKSPKL